MVLKLSSQENLEGSSKNQNGFKNEIQNQKVPKCDTVIQKPLSVRKGPFQFFKFPRTTFEGSMNLLKRFYLIGEPKVIFCITLLEPCFGPVSHFRNYLVLGGGGGGTFDGFS